MSIFSSVCPRCGKELAFLDLSGDLCDACLAEENRCAPAARKQAEMKLASERLEQERERIAKVERLISELKNPIAILLAKHIDESVQLNLTKADSLDTTTLVGVTEVFFTLQMGRGLLVHVPHSQILHILEPAGKPLYLQIVQLVIYKGAVGVGVSTSI